MDWLLTQKTLFVFQVITSVIVIALVLMQAKGVGLSGAFGGEGSFYRSRRGAEKIVFNMTIVFAGLFLLFSFLTLYSK
ncbi:MAG TPA: preprotein translocase subunit SecG [bacterium]|nr:preprotein translocase subunit SecG [bacterium]